MLVESYSFVCYCFSSSSEKGMNTQSHINRCAVSSKKKKKKNETKKQQSVWLPFISPTPSRSRISSKMTCIRTQPAPSQPWRLRSGWMAVMKIRSWSPWGRATCRPRAGSSKWQRRTCWTLNPPLDEACPLWTPAVCRWVVAMRDLQVPYCSISNS